MICPDDHYQLPTTPYKIGNCSIYVYQPNEVPAAGSYPLELEVYHDWKGRRCWREVHKCPRCMRELEMNMMEVEK